MAADLPSIKNIHQPNGSHLTDRDLTTQDGTCTSPKPAANTPSRDVTDDTVSPEPGGSAPVGKKRPGVSLYLGSHLGPAATNGPPAGGTPATLTRPDPQGRHNPGAPRPPRETQGRGVRLGHLPLSLHWRVPDWMLAGLVGGGAILGGGISWPWPTGAGQQLRNRRPGHTITTPVPGWPLSKGP